MAPSPQFLLEGPHVRKKPGRDRSSGNLTFGEESADFGESVADLVNGPPRLAPLWDDLDATSGLVIAAPTPHGTAIHFVSVPEFFSDSPNYFTVLMPRSGISLVSYGATARSDSLVGLTEGGGVEPPAEWNFSRWPAVFRRGTTYEQFVVPEPFDLSFRTLLWAPFF